MLFPILPTKTHHIDVLRLPAECADLELVRAATVSLATRTFEHPPGTAWAFHRQKSALKVSSKLVTLRCSLPCTRQLSAFHLDVNNNVNFLAVDNNAN